MNVLMQGAVYNCCSILHNTNCNHWLPIAAGPVANLHTNKTMVSAVNARQMLTVVTMVCAVSKLNQ